MAAAETKSTPAEAKPGSKDDSNSKSTITFVKSEVKAKTTSSSSLTLTKTTAVKTREKKVYSLPGQKYDIPEERDPLRLFYESLWKQIPSSEMAEFWMMEHGLLSPGRAKKAYEKKQMNQKQLRMGTLIKSPPHMSPSEAGSLKEQQVSKNLENRSKEKNH
ncbi:hypothetical protein NMG60_11027888 [Bertholletia excelsa]